MPNPLYSALGGGNQNPMIQQFTQFMNQMKGKDPNQIINEMVSSGKLSKHSSTKCRNRPSRCRECLILFVGCLSSRIKIPAGF